MITRGTKVDLIGEWQESQKRKREGKASHAFSFADENFEVKPTEAKDFYTPNPTAKRFHLSNAIMRLLRGPIGCGKTRACSYESFVISANIEPVGGIAKVAGMCVRNTYPLLRDNTLPSWIESMPNALSGEYKQQKGTFEGQFNVRRGENRHLVDLKVFFRSFETPKDTEKLQGAMLTWIFLNEASLLDRSVLAVGATRTGRYPQATDTTRQCVLADTNSFDRTHWLYELFYERIGVDKVARDLRCDPDELLAEFSYPGGRTAEAENLSHLPKGYYQFNALTYGEDWAKVMCDNEFAAMNAGLRCYKSFNRGLHATDKIEPIRELPLFVGIDLGMDAAIVICQETRAGVINVVDEFYVKEPEHLVNSIPALFSEIAKKYPPRRNDRDMHGWIWGVGGHDPGASSSWQNDPLKPEMILNQNSSRFGVCKTKPAVTNTVKPRIEIVESMLNRNYEGKPALRISNDCPFLVRACEMYSYRRMNVAATLGAVYADKPEKSKESHIAEALGYALLRPGGGGAALVRGDAIQTIERKRALQKWKETGSYAKQAGYSAGGGILV